MTVRQRAAHGRLDPRLLLLGAAACWGFGTDVSKQAVTAIPAISLLTLQLGVSVAGLAAAAAVTRSRIMPIRQERGIVALGLLNPGLAYALGLLGLTQISASLSVLIWALEPIAILGLAVALLSERPGGGVIALSAVAVAGLVAVLFDPASSGQASGILISAAGVGCCAVYTIAARAWLRSSDSTLAVIAGQQVLALLMATSLTVGVGVLGGSIWPAGIGASAVASAVLSGLLYYAAAYWLYLSALRAVPAAIASTAFYLIPIFGLAGGAFLGDRLGLVQWLGAVAVIAALGAIGRIAWRTPQAAAEAAAP